MNTQIIDGILYARMLFGAAATLSAHTEELNALNVFPVADGDTGTNMLRTIEGGLASLNKDEISNIGELSQIFARGILLSARGNSGVILSQIFAGINDGLDNCEAVNAVALARAYRKGIAKSYAAVQNPTEGTILTVFRESAEYAESKINESSTIEDFFRWHIEEARRSLAATKERLPVLAEADVVDSGAAGYLYIAEGMYKALGGEEIEYKPTSEKEQNAVNIDLFTRNSVLEYGYCTEFLLRLTESKVNVDQFDINTLISQLQALGGESIVAYKQDDIVKVHVHIFTPGAVLDCAQKYGEFLTVKIENMNLGHSETEKVKPKKNNKKYSIVAVATGEGMSSLFTQMGADQIICGGQTANPSAEEFINSFKKCESEHIIVLPNNKNIILAAKQAAELYNDAEVHIIETKSLMQGYSALSVITPGITDINSIVQSATNAAKQTVDCEVTKAVRNATINGKTVSCGEYMAISGGDIVAVAPTAEAAVIEMLENTDTDFCEIITLFVGKNVTEENRVSLTEQLKAIYEDCEIEVYIGGQDVYDYLVAVE